MVHLLTWFKHLLHIKIATNIAKVNIDQTICEFGKDWSKFTKWTLWINPYCPWLKIFQVAKKELLMEIYIYVESLKGRYVSIHIDLSLLYVLLIKIDQCFLMDDNNSQTILSVIQISLRRLKKKKSMRL